MVKKWVLPLSVILPLSVLTDHLPCDVYLSPHKFAKYRRNQWPDPDLGAANSHIFQGKRHRSAQCLGRQTCLPTRLHIPAWERYLAGSEDQLLDFVKFGFTMGYVGPTSDTSKIPNHPSAGEFPTHVHKFIEKELRQGGIIGPFVAPHSYNVSPLMSQPKAVITDRRIITDLTYPRAMSVNSYIRKNTVMGMTQSHCLPSLDAVVQRVQEIGKNAHLFTINISRAYKNFKSCPLDWPLLAIAWDDAFYLDVTMTFGSRDSSGHKQRVADALVKVLRDKDVIAHMYLDDLIVAVDRVSKATRQYQIVKQLRDELGHREDSTPIAGGKMAGHKCQRSTRHSLHPE